MNVDYWRPSLRSPTSVFRLDGAPSDQVLGQFAGDLRSRVFRSFASAGRHFGVSHTTISRYETGITRPPIGYLATLMRLIIDRFARTQIDVEGQREALLAEFNKAVLRFYEDEDVVSDWNQLCEISDDYIRQRRGHVTHRDDWGEAPAPEAFYGRQSELALLKRWVLTDHCRVIGLFGMGGIGKTSVAANLTHQLKPHFDHSFWYDLRNAPPLDTVLRDCIKFLSDRPVIKLPESPDSRISVLISLLQEKRGLLVFDNIESILRESDPGSHYREGYEGYADLIRRIAGTSHESCLVITSREKPNEFVRLEGETSPVRSLHLKGLSLAGARELLDEKDLIGSDEVRSDLNAKCAGNPLILKIISATIKDMFSGDIASFLVQGTLVLGDVRGVLQQQFDRLPSLSQTLMYWLAIRRKAVSIDELGKILIEPVPRADLLDSLESLLSRRSLIEGKARGFLLQPVIAEYVTDRFVDAICREITTGETNLLRSHALLNVQAADYVRENQVRLIMNPVTERLADTLGSQGLAERLQKVLSYLRNEGPTHPGYAAGNIINLLLHAGTNINGYDFSHLVIREGYLQGAELHGVNFAYSDLSKCTFTEVFGSVLSVAFSPDGNLMAAGDTRGDIRIWRTVDSRQMLICKGHEYWVGSVAFSPDSRFLASASNDQTVRLWDTQTGQCLFTLPDHTGRVRSVAFSSDGRTLVSGSDDRTVRLWDVKSGRCQMILQGDCHPTWPVALSPDGRMLATSCVEPEHTPRLWDIHTGKQLCALRGHVDRVRSIAFSPDSQVVGTAGDDHTVRLWDACTGECIHVLNGHSERVKSVTFSSKDHLIASGSDDHTVRLWNSDTGRCLDILEGHSNWVWTVAFSSDGNKLMSGGDDRAIRLWDVRTRRCLQTLQGYANSMRSVAFSPDRQTLASGSDDQVVRLWDSNTWQCTRTLRGHTSRVWTVAFSPDGRRLASGSDDQTIRLWNPITGQYLATLLGHEDWVWSIAFSPDCRILASGSGDCTVRLWDFRTERCLHVLERHDDRVRSVAFSPTGGLLASASDDQTIRLWDTESYECIQVLQGHESRVWGVAFGYNGQILASSSDDNTVRLWDTRSGQCLHELRGHTNLVRPVAFSPDGSSLASGSVDQSVRLWDAHTGQWIRTLEGHTDQVRSVTFGPDQDTIVSCGNDETIKVWSVNTGECLRTLRPNRPYERMDITGVLGLTEAQKDTLKALGAVENT